jgi:hypothetical protein
MKSLSLMVLALGAFGALALSGCSSCMPAKPDTTKKAADPVITCGPGTIPQGTKCIGPAAK